jgi:HEAT repeat protein
MTDDTIASFVANSVATDHGATERLAHAFEALVPESERKDSLLGLAEDKARATDLGKDTRFDELWQSAKDMLTSYSDKKFVSDEYGRELSAAKTRAVDVERVADDPPERVQQWLATISDASLRELDGLLLLDLLKIEDDPVRWSALATIVASELEKRVVLGELESAASLAAAILHEQNAAGRAQLAATAASVAERIASGPLVRHVVTHLRTADDAAVPAAARLCHLLGAAAVGPLAEALAIEENSRAIRILREILLDFGAVGRSSVEQLKTSTNPAVRRTAIDLLRVFGGDDALPELAPMLDDPDQQVQRDAVRAIVQIGTDAAYGILQRTLMGGSAARDTIVPQLISLREPKAIPLLCYVLANTAPGGSRTASHLQIIEALGTLSAHPESTAALRTVLNGGVWWAPFRTARLREAAATALLRIGSPETIAVLEQACRTGGRGVRKIARPKVAAAARRDRGAA